MKFKTYITYKCKACKKFYVEDELSESDSDICIYCAEVQKEDTESLDEDKNE